MLIVTRDGTDKICVPKTKISDVFHDVHDAIGHPGFSRSWNHCSKSFFRPSLYVLLKTYIEHCPTCIQIKVSRVPTPGSMPDLDVEPKAFHTVALDFVTGLPADQTTFQDCILLVVDIWTKAVILIPMFSTYTAKSVAEDFFVNVVRRGFLPHRFISDNDKVFIGKFWSALTERLRIRCRFTSPYHAQADPAERYNQTMETILCSWTMDHPLDWSSSLLYVEIAMNSMKNGSTGFTPYDLLYTNNSGPYNQLQQAAIRSGTEVDDVDDILTLAKARLSEAKDCIQHAHDLSKAQYDNRHTPLKIWKVGDYAKIRLSSRPIKIVDSSKLTEPYLGPYEVIEVHPRSVVLRLPATLKINPRFSVQHIEPCPSPESDPFNCPSRPMPVEMIEGEEAFEVESIVGKRIYGRSKLIQYRVKWKGYPLSEATWEFASDLIADDCENLINDYEKSLNEGRIDAPNSVHIFAHPTFVESFPMADDPATDAGPSESKLRKSFAYDQSEYAERPIAFESRVTRDYESHYESLELELSCLTWAILKSLKYIEGRNFTVYTDHQNLRSVLNSKSEVIYSRQVDKFRVLLMPYLSNIEFVHRPGRFHHNVDALSRLIDRSRDVSGPSGRAMS